MFQRLFDFVVLSILKNVKATYRIKGGAWFVMCHVPEVEKEGRVEGVGLIFVGTPLCVSERMLCR